MQKPLNSRVLERLVRGISCHRRIQILKLVDVSHDAPSLLTIAREVRTDFRVVSEHVRRLVAAGLDAKQTRGRAVLHDITPVGKRVLSFLRSLG